MSSDLGLWVHGVVVPDRSEALFAVAAVAWTPAMPAPRVRIRGLDPNGTYRLEPVNVGSPPSGLGAPSWWDSAPVLTGAVLARVGVTPPSLHPEQAVLLRVVATSTGT